MARLEKRIQAIEDNPRNVPSRQLAAVLHSLGFRRRSGRGSHQCFKHPSLPGVILTLPDQNPLRPAYVLKAMDAIHHLMEITRDDQ